MLEQGRHDEAEELTRVSEAATAPDDVASLVGWRRTRALLLVSRGDPEDAARLVHEARSLAARSDSLMLLGEAALAAATVFAKSHRVEAARAEARRAEELFASKGMASSAARARALSASL